MTRWITMVSLIVLTVLLAALAWVFLPPDSVAFVNAAGAENGILVSAHQAADF
jgi:hypothetical protein